MAMTSLAWFPFLHSTISRLLSSSSKSLLFSCLTSPKDSILDAQPAEHCPLVFPKTFILPDLLSIIAPVFEYRISPHEHSGEVAGRTWMHNHKPMNVVHIDRFIAKGNFARFASMCFPQADEQHFAIAYQFFLWAFMTDDSADRGGLSDGHTPDHVQGEVQAYWDVLEYQDPADARPVHPFAIMLQSICINLRKTATPGAYRRFVEGVRAWTAENVNQCHRRSEAWLPSVEEYIDIRRKTIGQGAVEAVLEYVTRAKLPDYVFEHPTIIAMSQATTDILTWPNDICSFNKEQADGDYQNFICILMHERNMDLQSAVDTLTEMIAQRVRDYAELKASLPSFGTEVDAELARYLAELEHETYGSVRWYYESPRYWRRVVEINRDLHIELFPCMTASS